MAKKKKAPSRSKECDCSALNEKNFWCGLTTCPNCNRPIKESQLEARRDLFGPDGIVWRKGGGRKDEESTANRRLEIIQDEESDQKISITGIAEMLVLRPDTSIEILPDYFIEFYEARKKALAEHENANSNGSRETHKGGVLLDDPLRVKSDKPIDPGAKRLEGETLSEYKTRRGLS